MANCNKYFETYNGEIRLTDSRRSKLKSSRKELRNKIRKWFKENKSDDIQPKFNGQGSMSTDTIINPIPRKVTEGNEEKTKLYYDVDDGVYFIGNQSKEERHSPATYHDWICKAINGHTEKDPIDKNTCVRTVFADGHHIDNPIYYKNGSIPDLAHKRDGYIQSDPKAFSEWFNFKAETEPQLRRLVRYAKGWSDYREYINSSKPMPSGLILTILFAQNPVFRKDRDDIALKETLIKIQDTLQKSFVCYRPTVPTEEDLLRNYAHQEYFMKCLNEFIGDAKSALQEKNYRKSTEFWRKHLSERFPLGEDKEDNSMLSLGLGTLITPTTKPYCGDEKFNFRR